MIKSNGGVFGRNPTFQDVTVDGNLTVNGDLALGDDITINDTLLVNGVATFNGGIVSTGTAAAPTSNTVMGSGAGAALQAGGTNNVLLGSSAGAAITTGDDVVAIGFDAAKLNTSNDTVAIGSGALDANTTGIFNTGVGYAALGSTTTGGSNVAVGRACLFNNTTGSANTAIGVASMFTATAGANNVALGTNTLFSNTGSNNCAIGWQAGRFRGAGTDTVTVANSSIFIGHQSRAAGDSQVNQIIIAGTDGIGDGSNTTVIGLSSTTQSRMFGTFLSTGANGQSTQLGQATTLLSALSGATVTATNLIPANCILLGVTARVTTAITGATTFDIGDGSTANRFGDDIAIAAGTTANNCIAPALITAATNVVLTANGSNFTAGAVRVTAHYMTLVAPTS
jgi:hypothetical protein